GPRRHLGRAGARRLGAGGDSADGRRRRGAGHHDGVGEPDGRWGAVRHRARDHAAARGRVGPGRTRRRRVRTAFPFHHRPGDRARRGPLMFGGTAMTTGLSVDDVTLTYPDGADRITALDRVSLDVPAGTIAAVSGPSGSGKSSLLAVVSTLIRPDSGQVRLDTGSGRVDLAALSRRDAAAMRRSSIGIVFQQANLVPALTAVEQLEAMGHLGQRWYTSAARRRRTHTRAMELLDAVGLADHAGKRPAQLSGG